MPQLLECTADLQTLFGNDKTTAIRHPSSVPCSQFNLTSPPASIRSCFQSRPAYLSDVQQPLPALDRVDIYGKPASKSRRSVPFISQPRVPLHCPRQQLSCLLLRRSTPCEAPCTRVRHSMSNMGQAWYGVNLDLMSLIRHRLTHLSSLCFAA